MKWVNAWLLGLVIGLGLVVRVVDFGEIPTSLNRDELALGYNAFSLSVEGVDEWGVRWPLVFKSFGDYKLPGYIYLLIPLIKFLGPNGWVVRLPSLIAGIANVYLVFVISKELFPKRKWVPILASLNMALMPWAIFYSRVAFEAHVGLALTLLYLYMLLVGRKKSVKLWWSVPVLMVAVLTYNAPLLLAPFILGSFLVMFRADLFKKNSIKQMASFALVSLSIIGLASWLMVSVNRAKTGITIFTDPTITSEYRVNRANLSERLPLVGKIFGNRVVYFGGEIFDRYVLSFLPDFLVYSGGQHPWHTLPGWSHLTMVQYGLFIGGLMVILVDKKKTNLKWWLVGLLFLSLGPAVITVDAPHATRSLLFLALTSIFGAYFLDKLIDKKRFFYVLIFLLTINSSLFIKDYYLNFAAVQSASWKQGLKNVVISLPDDNREVFITDYRSSPYIYVLFYKKILPSELMADVAYYPVDNAGLVHVERFGKYNFVENSNDAMSGILIDKSQNGQMEVVE